MYNYNDTFAICVCYNITIEGNERQSLEKNIIIMKGDQNNDLHKSLQQDN